MKPAPIRIITPLADEVPVGRADAQTLRKVAAETLARGGPSNRPAAPVSIGQLDGQTVLIVRVDATGTFELRPRPDLAYLLAPDPKHPTAIRVIFPSDTTKGKP